MKQKTKKIKLKDITQDPNLLSLRTVNAVFVSRYRQAYRNGADMPLIVVDKNNTVVSGNHRYQGIMDEFGPKHEITVFVQDFKSERDRLEFFTQENAKHGNPLDGISKKRIALALMKTGASVEEVASLFDVAVKKVEAWGDNCVMVTIGGKKTEMSPMKRGPEMDKGKPITQKVYKQHIKADRGISPLSLVSQLLRWLKAGWIQKNDKNLSAMKELVKELGSWIEDEGQRVV